MVCLKEFLKFQVAEKQKERYVQTIIVGKGKSACIVYYDYIKNEFDRETVSISTFRKDLRDLKKGDFIEILVKEKKNKLKFIDFR